ncbi:radical SAM family heme chaperone HemW [Reinekea marinisedimentorum]|uniref:Heme chaperone HemW n=1 Tax=Reinekea marinisedimentorum TaxID=230495 RepID=A0A4R3HXS1_9GAMM|nr:radical SAM family heme chaperone HemW [Reinekea marinisedimentorum]TCS38147.1 oxygen-independent coproporphyrinogen-3 oxidase [Reinekea marinisedimentorum]
MSTSAVTKRLPPLSAYVHVPWCIRKCPYCDFNSHASSAENIPEREFLKRVAEDIHQDAALAQGRKIETLFFGGGTPSLLSADAIGQILEMLDKQVGFAANAEITLEANPGTVEAQRFQGYHRAGVNRLSIGVQSFSDSYLQSLGRIHNAGDAMQAFITAREAGFDNINLDLMHGLPDQSLFDAMHDLDTAISLKPEHLSWYQLTIEANTEFYNSPPPIPEDDTLWDIQQAGQQKLANAGFGQYEVSAYAQPGKECRHNLNYWQYGDYLGIGPGAHGKYTHQNATTEIIRTRKTRLPKDYLNANKPLVRLEEAVAPADRPFDYFINSLRLRKATSLTEFEAFTGVPLAHIEAKLAELTNKGLLNRNNDLIATTDAGFLYLNEVLACWLE